MSRSQRPFWTRQYHNPALRDAYVRIAAEVRAETGGIDALVAPVGTGASACGLIQGFRRDKTPALVAVDTHGSVLFGQPDARRILRGLGNSIHPQNLLHELFDECHWVAADEAFAATRELARTFMIDAGPSSGAAFLVASWFAERHPTSRVAFVCADTGERYRSSVLNEAWLREHGLWRDTLPVEPVNVKDPRRCPAHWTRMEWSRRSLADVLAMDLDHAPDTVE